MDDLTIYICSHKDFSINELDKEKYSIITGRDIKNNSDLPLLKIDEKYSDKLWCELANHHYIYDHLNDYNKEYIGFCHYRRFFKFKNDIPEIKDIIVPSIITQPFNNVAMFEIYHNVDDMILATNIVKAKFSKYYNSVIKMMDSHTIIPYNMFIMKKDLYKEYGDFVFGVLDTIMQYYGIDNDVVKCVRYINSNKEKYFKSFYPNNTIDYQMRSMFGSLGERLSTAFFIYCKDELKLNLSFYDVDIVEHTYNKF